MSKKGWPTNLPICQDCSHQINKKGNRAGGTNMYAKMTTALCNQCLRRRDERAKQSPK